MPDFILDKRYFYRRSRTLKTGKMKLFLRQYGLIVFLSLVKFFITLFLPNPAFELHRDEYLYWDQGAHLAWGYMEVPPILGFLSYISRIFLSADSIWAVRIWGALFGALTVFMVGKMALKLRGGLFAQALAGGGILLGAYLRIHILFQANALDILVCTLICYEMIRYIQVSDKIYVDGGGINQPSWPARYYLLSIGLLTGLGVLGKYSVGFFLFGLFLGALLTLQRRIFRDPYFYGAILIAVCVAAPNLWWQYAHRFPVFHHFSELYDSQLGRLSPLVFLMNQVLLLFPVLIIWVSGLIWLLFSKTASPYRIFGFAYLGVIGLLVALHGKDYYALSAYPVLFAFGGVYLEKTTTYGWRSWLRPAMIVVPLVLAWFILPLAIPYRSPEKMTEACRNFKSLGLLKWEDDKDHALPQDYADMLGWEELTQKVAKAYNSCSPDVKRRIYIHCDNYGQVGALNFYGKKYGLPEAHSLNSSYILWAPVHPSVENILLISDHQLSAAKSAHFKSCIYTDSIVNPLAREKGTRIIFLSSPDSAATASFYAEGDSLKRLFTRDK